MKTLLSLYDYTGNWAEPFARRGWNVILWDIQHAAGLFPAVNNFDTFGDILQATATLFHENIFDNFGTIDGILIAQPCTEFAASGARWWKDKDADGRTAQAVALTRLSLAIVDVCKPDFWALENPVGRIGKLVPELGTPGLWFNPCDYGDPYTKKTALYGDFNANLKPCPVEPTEGSKMHRLGSRDKVKRSTTPAGFAEAFAKANANYIGRQRLEQMAFEDYDYYTEQCEALGLELEF